ncbi:MAG: polymerase [Treponema sp.]|nr:polymerase [Treponema sp.]
MVQIKRMILSGLLLVLGNRLFAQNMVNISGSVMWEHLEINADLSVNLAQAGIQLPTGRIYAEELISDGYQHLIRPQLLSLPIDSSTILRDLLEQGKISLKTTDLISGAAPARAPAMSTDLSTLSTHYTVDLRQLSTVLMRHDHPSDIMRTLIATPVVSYTGIIIIANDPMPVHGKRSSALTLPCLFPKVWDTDMNLIYDRSMVDKQSTTTMVRYVPPQRIFQDTPSGLDPELEALVGNNPLRIIARGVFGIRPTDPIIDRDDALLIISSEQNRTLLREGKVVIVLDNTTLTTTF